MAVNMLIHVSLVPSTRDRLPLELPVDSMFSWVTHTHTHIDAIHLPYISECMHSLLTQFPDPHGFLYRDKSTSTWLDIRSDTQNTGANVHVLFLLLSAASVSFASISCVYLLWIVDVLHLLHDHSVYSISAMIYTILASKIVYLWNCELIKQDFLLVVLFTFNRVSCTRCLYIFEK